MSCVPPEGLESIGRPAFNNCKSLREVRLPSTLKSIEKDAFTDCEALVMPHIPAGFEMHGKAFDRSF